MEFESCPNCGAKITGKLFGTAIVTHSTKYINKALGTDVAAHCTKCESDAYSRATSTSAQNKLSLQQERDALLAEAGPLLPSVPVASIHLPPRWDFDVVSLVTAQSVAGTGLFADVGATFTDMFGLQSGKFRDKIRAGEDLCQRELRLKALHAGGDAVVGSDIDYAEVGGARCMMMVCMTGTAVRLKSLDILNPSAAAALKRLREIVRRLDEIA